MGDATDAGGGAAGIAWTTGGAWVAAAAGVELKATSDTWESFWPHSTQWLCPATIRLAPQESQNPSDASDWPVLGPPLGMS